MSIQKSIPKSIRKKPVMQSNRFKSLFVEYAKRQMSIQKSFQKFIHKNIVMQSKCARCLFLECKATDVHSKVYSDLFSKVFLRIYSYAFRLFLRFIRGV